MSGLTVQDYHVGWICALHEELTAAMAMLDEEHDMLAQQDPQDRNNYLLGRVHQHNVVIVCMPEGVDGLVSAATVARDMARTFPALRVGLMVGIGGGIPHLVKGIDVRLGDIVVSVPQKTWGGVVQYDKGKAETGGQFVVKGQLNQPPALLLNAVTQLRARHMIRPSKVTTYIEEAMKQNPMLQENGFDRPVEPDCLHCSVCGGDVASPTIQCEATHVQRQPRKTRNPLAHYGVIASGNQVVKDAVVRDRLRDEFGAVCVEMEAAGLMNAFPCLVVRGICDYADAHKSDEWQPHAAMTAAAYVKELLQYISPAQTSQRQPIQEVLGLLEDIQHNSRAQLEATHAQTQQSKTEYETEKRSRCHQTFKVGHYEEQKDVNPERVEGTCQWVLSHNQYKQWDSAHKDDLLWISADPGCGKSVLAKSLVDHELRGTPSHSTCYFFFKDNNEQDNLATALCALLHQLFSQQPCLIKYAMQAWENAGKYLSEDVSEMWRILLAATRDGEAHDVTFILDGLDECRPCDRRLLINKLAHFYVDVSSLSPQPRKGRLRFLVTSRPYDDIRAEFQRTLDNLPTIRLRGEDENDEIHEEINLVIRWRVDKLAKDLPLDYQTTMQLTQRLLNIEHRTYLWLYLAIDDIAKTYRESLRPSQALIKLLPTTVEAAYEKILDRVSQENESHVKKILQIVIGARRPLNIHEMAIALGIATTTQPQSLDQTRLDPIWLEQRIRHWCGLFVFINHNRIHLIHQTAKEFLVSSERSSIALSGWKQCLGPGGVAKEMAQICITFLCFAEARSFVDQLGPAYQVYYGSDELRNPVQSFLRYSAQHWPHHLHETELPVSDALIRKACSLCDTDGDLYNIWFPIFLGMMGYRPVSKMNPIHVVACLGHEKVLRRMWQLQNSKYHIDALDGSGRTALMWACQFNHKKVVQSLLNMSANPNARGKKNTTSLLMASGRGLTQIVQLLLDRGADIIAQEQEPSSALLEASISGQTDVVQILLDRGANANAQHMMYDTALTAASAYGYTQIVELLLDKGANVNTREKDNTTALQAAASLEDNTRIVQLLLDKGADVNAPKGRYGTALEAASIYGLTEVVHMLLDKGADIER